MVFRAPERKRERERKTEREREGERGRGEAQGKQSIQIYSAVLRARLVEQMMSKRKCQRERGKVGVRERGSER